jgi:hydroxypyruvate isomerase
MAGVTLLLEPVNRYETDDPTTVDQTVKVRELGASNLKILADTFHTSIEEVDLTASLRRHAPPPAHVHLVVATSRYRCMATLT